MTFAASRSFPEWSLRPAVSGSVGVLVWMVALAVSHPTIAAPGEPGMTWGSWTVLVCSALIGLAIAYGLGRWGWSGSTGRLSGAAASLAVVAALAVSAPWSGWAHVFAATSLGLVVEHRRRIGSWTPTAAIVASLAGLALVVATLLCLLT